MSDSGQSVEAQINELIANAIHPSWVGTAIVMLAREIDAMKAAAS